MDNVFVAARKASRTIPRMTASERNAALLSVADLIESRAGELLTANAEDLDAMDPQNPLYDRLKLTPQRIASIVGDMCNVASLPDPLELVLDD